MTLECERKTKNEKLMNEKATLLLIRFEFFNAVDVAVVVVEVDVDHIVFVADNNDG